MLTRQKVITIRVAGLDRSPATMASVAKPCLYLHCRLEHLE